MTFSGARRPVRPVEQQQTQVQSHSGLLLLRRLRTVRIQRDFLLLDVENPAGAMHPAAGRPGILQRRRLWPTADRQVNFFDQKLLKKPQILTF